MSEETKRATLLIVDDDKNTRDGLARALRRVHDVVVAENGQRALEELDKRRIDVLLTDVRMPGIDGMALLQRALARCPGLICILLTAYGNVETAVTAIKRGAYDFLTKPVNLDHLELLLDRALNSRAMASENANLRELLDDKYGLESLVGSAPAMQELFETIRQAAPTQATILLSGDTGTGKELVAHALHHLSTRSRGPFVAVHCAALSSNLLESELFGHEKGAFTGAVSRRRGRFEMADGGTLFLDEISEIDASIQVKLLRVLEERTFERVGGSEPVEVDIRLIAASNRDLRALAAEGKFREDLYFRLDVVNVHLPPLRERAEDIPILCQHFLKEFSEKNSKPLDGITAETCDLMAAYRWPGNVRELRNTVEKMVVLARGPKLTPRDIPRHIREAVKRPAEAGGHPLPAAESPASLADVERRLIEETLGRCGGNVTRAAAELGVSRRTLHRKLNAWKAEDADHPAAAPEQPAGG
jgi:two-component system response regulator AtoC